VVHVAPFRRKKGVMHARRVALVSPPPGAVTPRCAAFGLCGGCTLQELGLPAQRAAKRAMALESLGDLGGVEAGPIHGPPAAYGYRNKVELSYGVRRYVSEADKLAGAAIEGAWLGFHAPGRFDRVVDAARCELVSEAQNAVIAAARAHLANSAFDPWDVRAHVGFWRHLVLRETSLGQRLAAIYTAPPPAGREAEARAEVDALAAALPDVRGALWHVNERVADAAIGPRRAILRGEAFVEEALGPVTYRLGATSFFQTNTSAARILYDVVGRMAGAGDRLIDLYCGAGAIGLYLADRFPAVLGVELNEAAVADARANAARSGVSNATYIAGPVEAHLDAVTAGDVVVVDPPRAGLHPKAAAHLAALDAPRLVYVACKPASLARDRKILEAGRWRLDAVEAVDLFPQTGHIELVTRFAPDTALH